MLDEDQLIWHIVKFKTFLQTPLLVHDLLVGNDLSRAELLQLVYSLARMLRGDGVWQEQACQTCGDQYKMRLHHCDYCKPFEVQWLCDKCHTQWHSRYPGLTRNTDVILLRATLFRIFSKIEKQFDEEKLLRQQSKIALREMKAQWLSETRRANGNDATFPTTSDASAH
jgi:hypothetical protein